MSTAEAKAVLIKELAKYRGRSYRELSALVETPEAFFVSAPSGTQYQVEVEGIWDDKPNGLLRVHGMIDGGGIDPRHPMVECFLIAPSGKLIDVQESKPAI
jgi:hypothetical protein